MRKRKKILKNLSTEIFNDKKEDTNYDIFADKDNLIIEDNSQTPKLEEDNSIELGEINNILQNKIEDKTADNSINGLKITPIFPNSEIKEDNNDKIEDSNNSTTVEPVFPEINDENTSIIDTKQSNKDNLDNDEAMNFSHINSEEEKEKTNNNTTVEPVFPEIAEDNTSITNDEQIDNNDKLDNSYEELEEDKTSLNELISSDDNSLSEIERDLSNEEDDDTTFNELNERIKDDISLENDDTNDNITDNEEPEIIGNFPKIEKFGSVVPNK